MRSKTNPLALVVLAIVLSISLCGYLTPQHVQQHIKRLISEKYQLYVINLGTTVNNNPLKAYVITGIKKQQTRISQLRNYPATLVTSYMHPRQPYSVKLMETLLDDVLNNYNSDYFFRYMLDNTLLILFPFVNVDGYYQYKKLTDEGASTATKEQYRKNMNKYGKCLMDWQYGVDINRNFDSSWGQLRTSDNQCGQEYRGPSPFSQKQSKAIRTLYNKFKINLAVDIHSYGNQWIYPYASQTSNSKLQSHKLYPLYQNLFDAFKLAKRPMKSCYQSLGYTADGVYIDWALDQGALSLAVEVGSMFDGDVNIGSELLFQVQELFHKVLKKNSISYSRFITQSHQLVIISTSLLDFEIQITLLDGTVLKQLNLKSREVIVFEVSEEHELIVVRVKHTKVQQTLELAKLKQIDTSDIPNYQGNIGVYMFKKFLKILLVALCCVGVGAGAYFVYMKRKNITKLVAANEEAEESGNLVTLDSNLQASSNKLKNRSKPPKSLDDTSNPSTAEGLQDEEESSARTNRRLIRE